MMRFLFAVVFTGLIALTFAADQKLADEICEEAMNITSFKELQSLINSDAKTVTLKLNNAIRQYNAIATEETKPGFDLAVSLYRQMIAYYQSGITNMLNTAESSGEKEKMKLIRQAFAVLKMFRLKLQKVDVVPKINFNSSEEFLSEINDKFETTTTKTLATLEKVAQMLSARGSKFWAKAHENMIQFLRSSFSELKNKFTTIPPLAKSVSEQILNYSIDISVQVVGARLNIR